MSIPLEAVELVESLDEPGPVLTRLDLKSLPEAIDLKDLLSSLDDCAPAGVLRLNQESLVMSLTEAEREAVSRCLTDDYAVEDYDLTPVGRHSPSADGPDEGPRDDGEQLGSDIGEQLNRLEHQLDATASAVDAAIDDGVSRLGEALVLGFQRLFKGIEDTGARVQRDIVAQLGAQSPAAEGPDPAFELTLTSALEEMEGRLSNSFATTLRQIEQATAASTSNGPDAESLSDLGDRLLARVDILQEHIGQVSTTAIADRLDAIEKQLKQLDWPQPETSSSDMTSDTELEEIRSALKTLENMIGAADDRSIALEKMSLTRSTLAIEAIVRRLGPLTEALESRVEDDPAEPVDGETSPGPDSFDEGALSTE